MTHIFTIPANEFPDYEVGAKRYLFVKEHAKYATNDKAILQPDDGRHQIELVITFIEHGPGSKHVNSHYCLLGLYTTLNDIPDSVGGGHHNVTE